MGELCCGESLFTAWEGEGGGGREERREEGREGGFAHAFL